MSGTLQNGSFSNVQKTMRLRIMGLDLEFNKEYLNCIKSMTGHDLRKKAFEVSIIANAAGKISRSFVVPFIKIVVNLNIFRLNINNSRNFRRKYCQSSE